MLGRSSGNGCTAAAPRSLYRYQALHEKRKSTSEHSDRSQEKKKGKALSHINKKSRNFIFLHEMEKNENTQCFRVS